MRKLLSVFIAVLVAWGIVAWLDQRRPSMEPVASSSIEGREVGDAAAGPLLFSYCHTQHRCELATSDPDGNSFRLLTRNDFFAGKPAWSPDGEWIAFQHDGGSKPGIYVIRRDGAGLQRLVRTTDARKAFYPCWLDERTVGFTYGNSFATVSLDGSEIEKHRRAYTADCARGTMAFPQTVRKRVRGEEVLFEQVVVGDPEGDVTNVVAHSQLEFSEPTLSPDGELVAFCAEEPAYGSGSWVALAGADGDGRWRRVGAIACEEIDWISDGEQLVVGPCHPNCYTLVDVATGKARRVPVARPVQDIDWRT